MPLLRRRVSARVVFAVDSLNLAIALLHSAAPCSGLLHDEGLPATRIALRLHQLFLQVPVTGGSQDIRFPGLAASSWVREMSAATFQDPRRPLIDPVRT